MRRRRISTGRTQRHFPVRSRARSRMSRGTSTCAGREPTITCRSRDPRFREAVADVAAPLHGRAKDDLIGEDVRQHRRTVRLVRGAAALLSVLAISTTVGAIFAMSQRNTAREQGRRAEQQALVALSRGLAGQALVRLETRPDQGFLLALEAYAMRPTPEAREAAVQAVHRSEGMIACCGRSPKRSRRSS